MRPLLSKDDAARGLRRLAGEILERHRGSNGLILVGIRRGGVPLAEKLSELLIELEPNSGPVRLGTIDITLYRDDAATALPSPRIGPSVLPVAIESQNVILVDDVLFTGRTIRAALDALLDYGRPGCVELAVLVERDGRELPIASNYCVKKVEVSPGERVDVRFESGLFSAWGVPSDAPSMLPPPPEELS